MLLEPYRFVYASKRKVRTAEFIKYIHDGEIMEVTPLYMFSFARDDVESVSLNRWESSKAVQMSWNEGHKWSATVVLPLWQIQEFKCVMREKSGTDSWQV